MDDKVWGDGLIPVSAGCCGYGGHTHQGVAVGLRLFGCSWCEILLDGIEQESPKLNGLLSWDALSSVPKSFAPSLWETGCFVGYQISSTEGCLHIVG